MDEYTGDQVLHWYERMEISILEFSKHVPLVQQNESLESPFLVSCLIDACGLLDSLFRDLVDESQPVNGKKKKKKDYDIQDYAECFSARFNLPNMRSILLQAPPRYLTPFSSWSKRTEKGKYPRPTWWNAYTHLKHDRLTSIKEGTLGATLNALCALHQILARTTNVEIFKLLLRRGWIESDFSTPENLVEKFEHGRTPMHGYFLVQTNLFAVPTGKFKNTDTFDLTEFPENIENVNPNRYRSNEELAKFLGRLILKNP